MAKKVKKRIAIIVDVEGWAYYNNAVGIKENLKQYYDIDIISSDIFKDNIVKMLILGLDYDLLYFMWRGHISWLYSEMSKQYIKDLGYEFEEFLQKFVKSRNILTGVYDHLFINSEEERTKFILENIKDYGVSSKKLKEIYDRLYKKKPALVINDGVDLALFKMNNKNKYDNLNENHIFKIGWTGNSKFTDENDDDLKGLGHVITPAINELKKDEYKIELCIADRNIKLIPHNEMPSYYNNIDIYVCASRTEGTPDTILEAMACGVPIISTDVGIIPEVFGKKQKKYIIKRTKDELKEKLVDLITNKEKLKILSNENLNQIKQWDWKQKAQEYRNLFDKNLREGELNGRK